MTFNSVTRVFRRKYVWIISLLSLIVCNMILDPFPSFNIPQMISRRGDATKHWRGEKANNVFSRIDHSSEAIRHVSPPDGFPWHSWSSPSIDAHLLLKELSLINDLSLIKELSDTKSTMTQGTYNTTFEPKFYRTLIPYVVRNGVAFHPKRKETMLNMKRWKQFEKDLRDSLRLAMKLQDEDPRVAALVTEEFPFILAHDDTPWCSSREGEHIPIFSWFTIKDCGYSWPVPDYHISSCKKKGTRDWDIQFSEWESKYPWDSKLQKAIWRGTMTGPNVRDWRDLPRAKLVQQSIIDQQRTIDAAFAEHPVEKRTKKEEEALNESRVVPHMLEEDYMKYKAIIDIDGNSWSSRYGCILCYNSVIIKVSGQICKIPILIHFLLDWFSVYCFKVESPDGFMSYYEKELKPWEHYIPVHSNLSDLQSAVSFAVSDESAEQVRTIIKNAQSWCQARLLKGRLAADLMWTLASYVELLNKEDGWHDMWKNNTRAYNLTEMGMQQIT